MSAGCDPKAWYTLKVFFSFNPSGLKKKKDSSGGAAVLMLDLPFCSIVFWQGGNPPARLFWSALSAIGLEHWSGAERQTFFGHAPTKEAGRTDQLQYTGTECRPVSVDAAWFGPCVLGLILISLCKGKQNVFSCWGNNTLLFFCFQCADVSY